MKTVLTQILMILLIVSGKYMGAQGFVDLNFESARIVPASGDQYNRVQFTQAFPGWTGYIGTNAATLALYNNLFLDSSGIGILDSNSPFGFVQEHYSAVLEAGLVLGSTTQTADATLLQTGHIPTGTQSLLFDAQSAGANLFAVTLNGQTLPLIPLSNTPNYTLYGTNIQAWAGQTATLAFTVIAQQPHVDNSILYLDDIQFSFSPIPEPDAFGLFALGGLFLAWQRRRATSYNKHNRAN